MKTVNQLIVREIERISDDLHISKREAAESLRRQFEAEGLLFSLAHVNEALKHLPVEPVA